VKILKNTPESFVTANASSDRDFAGIVVRAATLYLPRLKELSFIVQTTSTGSGCISGSKPVAV